MWTSRYAYRELPKFDPGNYHPWANSVKDAFAERDWMNYLGTPAPIVATSPPTDGGDHVADTATSPVATDGPGDHVAEPASFTPDPATSAHAKAFLSQSINHQYQSAIERCTSAAEIWSVFLDRYGQRSRDDELRLEAPLPRQATYARP